MTSAAAAMNTTAYYLNPPAAGHGAGPLSTASPGRIDSTDFLRESYCFIPGRLGCSATQPPYISSDHIAFDEDIGAGLVINVSGAVVDDMWTWNYFYPVESPLSGQLSSTCWMKIEGPGEPDNDSGETAVVSNCFEDGQVRVLGTLGSSCPCAADMGGLMLPDEFPPDLRGTWPVSVDYTDPQNATTPGVASDVVFLMQTPAVLETHGYSSGCDDIDTLTALLRQTLGVQDDRVKCYPYDWGIGVTDAAVGMARAVRDYRIQLGLGASDEIDLVGHSMGGLVDRMYYEHFYDSIDGPIGSISMLGTPNNGVALAHIPRWLCLNVLGWKPLKCKLRDLANKFTEKFNLDIANQSLLDLAPKSGVLHQLNDNFVLPSTPLYRVHIAHAPTGPHKLLGFFISLEPDNDCVVGASSVGGPKQVFVDGNPSFDDPDISHDYHFCNSPSLIDDSGVTDQLAITIKGTPPGGEPDVPAPQQQSGAEDPGSTMLDSVTGVAQQDATNSSSLDVPAGVTSASIVLMWLGGEQGQPASDLGFTLHRPDGTAVSSTDSDVAGVLDSSGDQQFNLLSRGFAINAPAAGIWQFEVHGNSVSTEGEGYVVEVLPDTQVGLSADVTPASALVGAPRVIIAQLIDQGSGVAASSVQASLILPDSSVQAFPLFDDGTNGDAVAGDHVYSVAFASATACGFYSYTINATGGTSEGAVTRQAIGTFSVNVPGDAVRDPCSADDDGDGLTDDAELNTHQTDPLVADTDGDGLSDGDEVNTTHTDPLAADTDGDGLSDGDEVNTYLTDPLVADTDGDGLSDGDEVNTYLTNPLLADTDGDGLSDGAEVNTYLTNPLVADTDGDGLSDGAEVNTYATNPLVADTDGDGCEDGPEVNATFATLDPNDAWDFHSVPAPALFVAPDPTTDFKDNNVGASDSQSVFKYFQAGAKTGTLLYDQDLNQNGIADGVEYDRSVLGPGESGPPDGKVLASDAQITFAQFKLGFHC